MTHLEIKDWEKHQHYKNKGVPWIKLYAKLLDDDSFMALSEVTQAQLVKLWVLASRMGNPLPNRPAFLAGKIGTKKLRLEEMLSAGFLIPCEARKSLDKIQTNPRPLSRELEREVETTKQSVAPAHADKFDDPRHVAAYQHFWQTARFPAGLDGELTALESGMHKLTARPVPWAVLGQAMHEMATNNHTFAVRHFGGFVRRIQAAPDPVAEFSGKMGRKLTVGEENYIRALRVIAADAVSETPPENTENTDNPRAA